MDGARKQRSGRSRSISAVRQTCRWMEVLINIHQCELEYNQECLATRHFHLVNEIIKRLNVHPMKSGLEDFFVTFDVALNSICFNN